MLIQEPLWYKDAIIYELRVGTFSDNSGSGIGDFAGLTQKLDYLRDLGVTALWLLPFYPSPHKDDGYDIADYTDIHASYGSLQEFRTFLRESHERGLRVITELVLNHTSDQHPWFQRARKSPPGSPFRDFYVWSDHPDKYKETRIIFKDFETSNWHWDPTAKSYYWHRFYSHQPDLNFDNPLVRKEMLKVVDFWLEMGVDGLRLDAVPYFFEREKTNCENLPETHAFLKDLRKHVDKKFKNRMLLAEANQWPEDASAYFGNGDECHMAFHFPIMPRLFMAVQMEDRFPVIDILQQTPALPEVCQWALFLRNHDELTLEMVTDEERDYMVRMYARDPQARINVGIRRRLAPLLGNNRRKIEIMNGLLFSLPGTPVLYYGDEIGMGDNIYLGDRNGVRTPMHWSPDRNAGFSKANPQKLFLPVITDPEYHYEALNVESQQGNPHSLLWWMKRFIALRKRYKAFGRGTIEFLQPENHKVLSFIRRYENETILVVANLSRFAQYVEMDLSPFKGKQPIELFGQTPFPLIGELSYLLTLGPHTFFWFLIESPAVSAPTLQSGETAPLPHLQIKDSIESLFNGDAKSQLETLLLSAIRERRWFGGKGHKIRRVRIVEGLPFPVARKEAFFLIIQVEYFDWDLETYMVPVVFVTNDQSVEIKNQSPTALMAEVKTKSKVGILADGMADKDFCSAMLDCIIRKRQFKFPSGKLSAHASPRLSDELKKTASSLSVSLGKAEQSNSSVMYGNQFIFKLFRRMHNGMNPDLEIGLFLSQKAGFTHVPAIVGHFEYKKSGEEPMTIGMMQEFIPNQGDAWTYTIEQIENFLEGMLTLDQPLPDSLSPDGKTLTGLAKEDFPDLMKERMGPFLETLRLLGQRTGELHIALASEAEDEKFLLEPFSTLYQRSQYQSLRNLTLDAFLLLKKRLKNLPEQVKTTADKVIYLEPKILIFFQSLTKMKITASRIRVHGDYHLGQVLFTGKDFIIIDFEGEPARPLGQRKIKRCPLRDVAGMIRSFQYASHVALTNQMSRGIIAADKKELAEKGSDLWTLWASVAFLQSYLRSTENAPFSSKDPGEIETLLKVFLLEKALYELGYELNNRPDWVHIPLEGISHLMKEHIS